MGLITNFLSIIIGGILGLTIGKKFNEDIKNIIVDCAGIFIMVIGIKSALVAEKDIMILIYLIIGAVIGQIINIDKRIKDFSQFLEDKFIKEKNSLNNEKSFAKGFSTATILYCVGAMAILGSINSGLTNYYFKYKSNIRWGYINSSNLYIWDRSYFFCYFCNSLSRNILSFCKPN